MSGFQRVLYHLTSNSDYKIFNKKVGDIQKVKSRDSIPEL